LGASQQAPLALVDAAATPLDGKANCTVGCNRGEPDRATLESRKHGLAAAAERGADVVMITVRQARAKRDSQRIALFVPGYGRAK